MNEYPKRIIVDGVAVTVENAAEEARWAKVNGDDPENASVEAPPYDASEEGVTEEVEESDVPKKKGAKKK